MASSDEEPQLPFSAPIEEIGSAEIWDSPDLQAPYLPTNPEKLRAMLSTVSFTGSEVLWDLGCGDGRVLFEACDRGCGRSLGVEMDPELVRFINEKAQKMNLSQRINAICGNFMEVNLEEATIIYVYLLPKALAGLQSRIEALFLKGRLRLVISSLFRFPELHARCEENPILQYYKYTPLA